MKKILIATAAMAALAATSAQAQEPSDSWTINGSVDATCAVNSQQGDVTLGELADENGFLDAAAVQAELIEGINAAPTEAWCSGNNNTVVLSRTALVRNNDGTDLNDFAEAVLFDLGVKFASGDESLNPLNSNGDEGTSDGAGNGPTVVERFGPTGDGQLLQFVNDSATSGTPFVIDRPSADDDAGPTSSFTANPDTRLASGGYTGTVTLTLTAGA